MYYNNTMFTIVLSVTRVIGQILSDNDLFDIVFVGTDFILYRHIRYILLFTF